MRGLSASGTEPVPKSLAFDLSRLSRGHVIGMSVFVFLSLAAIVAAISVWQRKVVLTRATSTVSNIALSLEQHTARTLEAADLTLQVVAASLESGQLGRLSPGEAHLFLRQFADNSPALRSIFLIDAAGRATHDSGAEKPRFTGVTDRDYFTVHRDNPDAGFFITETRQNRMAGEWSIFISRRINGAGGRFEGAVVAIVEPAYLLRFYETFDIGERGNITLFNHDGAILVRRPWVDSVIGPAKGEANRAIRRVMALRSGVYESPSPVDGELRISAHRTFAPLPISAIVGVSKSEVLSAWERQTIALATVAMLIWVLVTLLAARLFKTARVLVGRNHELEAAEARLAEQSGLLRATLDRMEQGLIYIDPSGRVAVVNERANTLLGLPPDLAERQAHYLELRALLRRSGKWARLRPPTGDRRDGDSELMFERMTADGGIVEVRTVATPDRGFIQTVTDITERRRAESKLQESEARYRLIAANMNDVIVMMRRADGWRSYVSPSITKLLGYTPEEFRAQPQYGLVHPDDLGELTRQVASLTPAEPSCTNRHRLRRADGEWLWVETVFSLVPDAAADSADVVAVLRDATDAESSRAAMEAAREQAETASRAKSDFLAAMSHEIRTPLNGILGYTELMLGDAALGDEQRRNVNRINGAGQALLTIVNDILDLSVIEAGKLVIDDQPYRLRDTVDVAASIVEPQAQRKGLAFHIQLDPALPDQLRGDEGRVRQVLLNLLNNAVKFTHVGEVTLSAHRIESARGPRMLIEVADTGIGIPSDKAANLFQRFTQLDGSIRREYGGTGLGLAICKNLVTRMGGTIGVRSHKGGGSVFWFELPVVEAEAPTWMFQFTTCGASRGVSVLLVEDVEINQDIAAQMLRNDGHSVDIVSDGADAVMAVQANAYDVVLMDVQMGGMDGLTATQRIRALDHPARDVPIVALTANVLPDQVAELKAAGMDGHVGKPVRAAELCEAVRLFARRRELEPERAAPASTGPEPAVAGDAAAARDPFDAKVIAELREMLGPERLTALLGQLAEQTEALDLTAPAATLAPAAHRLVSAAGMLGFAELSAASRTLEEACITGGCVAEAAEAFDAARQAARPAWDRLCAA